MPLYNCIVQWYVIVYQYGYGHRMLQHRQLVLLNCCLATKSDGMAFMLWLYQTLFSLFHPFLHLPPPGSPPPLVPSPFHLSLPPSFPSFHLPCFPLLPTSPISPSQDSAPLHCFSLAGCSVQPEYPQANSNRHILHLIHTDKDKCDKCEPIPKLPIPMSVGNNAPFPPRQSLVSDLTHHQKYSQYETPDIRDCE